MGGGIGQRIEAAVFLPLTVEWGLHPLHRVVMVAALLAMAVELILTLVLPQLLRLLLLFRAWATMNRQPLNLMEILQILPQALT